MTLLPPLTVLAIAGGLTGIVLAGLQPWYLPRRALTAGAWIAVGALWCGAAAAFLAGQPVVGGITIAGSWWLLLGLWRNARRAA
jgi:hypothetical protein